MKMIGRVAIVPLLHDNEANQDCSKGWGKRLGKQKGVFSLEGKKTPGGIRMAVLHIFI